MEICIWTKFGFKTLFRSPKTCKKVYFRSYTFLHVYDRNDKTRAVRNVDSRLSLTLHIPLVMNFSIY